MFRHLVSSTTESDTGASRILRRVVPGIYSINISRELKSTLPGEVVDLEVVVVPIEEIAARGVFCDETWRRGFGE